MSGAGPFQQSNSRNVRSGMAADPSYGRPAARADHSFLNAGIHQITFSIPEFRSAANATDIGLLFSPSGVVLAHGIGRKSASIRQRCRAGTRRKRAREAEGNTK